MATQGVAAVGGGFAKALPTYSRSVTMVGGPEISIVRPAWGGTAALRKAVDWLPRIDEPVVDARGRMTTRWYQFFREIATRLGGLNGDSVLSIVNNLQTTQAVLTASLQYSQAVGQYAQNVGAQATALTASVKAAGTPVSSVPPPAPSPVYRDPPPTKGAIP